MTATVLRYSGLVLAAGAVLLALALISISLIPVAGQILTPAVSWLLLLAAILLSISLPGVYLKQGDAPRLGEIPQGKLWVWLLLAGHLLMQAGLLFFVIMAAPALTFPGLKLPFSQSATASLLGFALFAGLVLTGMASQRAGVFLRWQAALLLAAAAGFFLAFFIAGFLPPIFGQVVTALLGIVLAVALAGMGIFIWDAQYLTVKYWAG